MPMSSLLESDPDVHPFTDALAATKLAIFGSPRVYRNPHQLARGHRAVWIVPVRDGMARAVILGQCSHGRLPPQVIAKASAVIRIAQTRSKNIRNV